MSSLKEIILKTPLLKELVPVYRSFQRWRDKKQFSGSDTFWEDRYRAGGDSGPGSYHRLAAFKAKVINDFIVEKNVGSAIEFGCGDGNNLSLVNYPKYIGLDVSPTSTRLCINKFQNDNSKSFYVYNSLSFLDNHQLFRADMSLSLDVIYHLVEDEIYAKYMTDLFQSAQKYVIIYSWDESGTQDFHQKSRNFSKWVTENQPSFKLISRIENPYPFDASDPENTSNAVFMMYELA
jgi:hypothetical protein